VIAISSPKNKNYETSEIPLTFTVNEQAQWLSYSLDGQPAVAINGNTTLTGLTVGAHTLTINAQDLRGLATTSETIQFTVASRFPIELVLTGVAIAVAASVSCLLYVKRRDLSNFKKKGLQAS
jgi:hypothetical protein